MSRGLSNNDGLETAFAACRRELEYSGIQAIREVFRDMPKRGTVAVSCRWKDVPMAVSALGQAGFFAIQIAPREDHALLTAWKGKAGACYETGRTATYRGSAAAALDDDGHLIFGAMRVCEKTGGFYSLPPYRQLVDVSLPEPALLARLDSDPLPFDCNTFERDAAALAAQLRGRTPAEALTTPVLYAGPFRLLVLEDGSLLCRGIPTLITAAQRRRLAGTDSLLDVSPDLAPAARAAESFPLRYAAEGPVCLLAPPTVCDLPGRATGAVSRDFAALNAISPALRERLRALLERGTAYFILGGSDPRLADGCCPNDEVGDANRLVEAGILASHQPPAQPDACTSTVYALADEIVANAAGSPTFTANAPLRAEVAARLARAPARRRSVLRTVIGAALLALVVAGLTVAVRQTVAAGSPGYSNVDVAELAAALAPPRAADGVLVIFFQAPERCHTCATMRRLMNETVAAQFAAEQEAGRLAVREVDLAVARYAGLRAHPALAFTTVGLLRFKNHRATDLILLTKQVWSNYRDDAAFHTMLGDAIRAALAHPS